MTTAATLNDHRRRIKRVMLHVDQAMDRRCRLADLAGEACYAPFHFKRVFEALMGESPHQYVYRKRMERAGFLLLGSPRRVIDIALEVGYETASAFCKGFKAYAGCSPRRFRDSVSQAWFLRTNRPFHPATGGNRRPPAGRPAIRTLPPLTVVYHRNDRIVEGSFLKTGRAAFKKLAASLIDHDLQGAVTAYIGVYPYRFFGLTDGIATSYTGAVIDPQRRVAQVPDRLVLPAGRYAVFPHRGPYEFLMQTWNAAYLSGLPGSGYTLRDAPPFELYLSGPSAPDDARRRALIWIPVH